ncbi:ferrous iron transport protein B, partial [Promineifilum sp.]|uniref:ferrous iron transport protein B n=1 Tax=Promineifilum sp. TaxID=2664178 RepID=UPI0035B0872D
MKPEENPCATCPLHSPGPLERHGLDMGDADYVVALAGNPNVGKSTVFNALTGLRQHTGNWPGKTVARAEGGFTYDGHRFKLVDLPGTYSLLSTSRDEEIARDFILFGRPDVTLIVVDASRLERNLNLALQVLEITDRAVICLNLVDEAARRGVTVDHRRLARDLGVPVVPTAARQGRGLDDLLRAINDVAAQRGAAGRVAGRPHRVQHASAVGRAVDELAAHIGAALPDLPNARWVALRLLDGDERIAAALRDGELAQLATARPDRWTADDNPPVDHRPPPTCQALLDTAERLRWQIGANFHEQLMEDIYADAARLADRSVTRPDPLPGGEGVRPPRPLGEGWGEGLAARFDLDHAIDRVVTSRRWGFPLMILLFTVVFWITIAGANAPSRWLSFVLIDTLYPLLQRGATTAGFPWWLSGLLIDGMYLATAWVVSVMLPPMAIFFPLFTLLEDFGYLPRVAFNLDSAFKRSGAHGRQALSMMMGFGCNAAGVVATRVIDSPRERLIAMLTNNFALCNG